MKTQLQLEAGRLYQVKHFEKGWIIAEYVKEVPAHSYKYNNLNMSTLQTGPDRIKNVPLSHVWKRVRAKEFNITFTVEDRGMEVRPVTEEAIATIALLKSEIIRIDEERNTKRRELKEFCE
jgi:uncharacterized small protein (DUF1192 family)